MILPLFEGHLTRVGRDGRDYYRRLESRHPEALRRASHRRVSVGAGRVFYVEVAGVRFFPRFFLDPSYNKRSFPIELPCQGQRNAVLRLIRRILG